MKALAHFLLLGSGSRPDCASRVPPDVGLTPSAAWRAPPPSTPLCARTPPPHQPESPPPRTLQKEPRGVGGRGKERAGKEGVWLGEGPSNHNGGWGGPSKHQLGPDPHLGAPKQDSNKTSPMQTYLEIYLRCTEGGDKTSQYPCLVAVLSNYIFRPKTLPYQRTKFKFLRPISAGFEPLLPDFLFQFHSNNTLCLESSEFCYGKFSLWIVLA